MMQAGLFARDETYRAENFSTCSEDRPLISQFCTDDPDLFVKAGLLIENDCDAIDLNLGCPPKGVIMDLFYKMNGSSSMIYVIIWCFYFH
jgi:tRNA-dihydrouridine synthase